MHDPMHGKSADETMRGLAFVHFKRAVPLARDDEVPLPIGGIINCHPFDICREPIGTDCRNARAGSACIWLSAEFPEATRLRRQIELARLIICDHALHRPTRLER